MGVRNFLVVVGGVCAAAAGFIILSATRTRPVTDLAQQLEAAWADHHTRA